MARLTLEDCMHNVANRYDLVLLAARRARSLSAGHEALIEVEDDKPTVVALREIAKGLITQENIDAIDQPRDEQGMSPEGGVLFAPPPAIADPAIAGPAITGMAPTGERATAPETAPETVPETVPETAPETVPEAAEAAPETAPEASPEAAEAAPEASPEAAEAAPEAEEAVAGHKDDRDGALPETASAAEAIPAPEDEPAPG